MAEGVGVEQSDEFRAWLKSMRDKPTRSRIDARVKRVAYGLLGQTRTLGGGLEELKLDFGPGYRVYFARRGDRLVILLAGGGVIAAATAGIATGCSMSPAFPTAAIEAWQGPGAETDTRRAS